MWYDHPPLLEQVNSPLTPQPSPRTALDEKTNTLYLTIHQLFSPWFIPFFRARVRHVSVLHLSQSPPSPPTSPSTDRHPPPPPPYHAAQDKLHAVQEGTEPSYAAVVSGEAPASPSHPHPPARARSGSTESATAPPRYWIQKQQDLYQTTELFKFVPLAPATALAGFWQLLATLFCVLAVATLSPFVRAAFPAKSGSKKRR
ncbi:hypothetical protein C8A05DRAFT_40365 [Staphylotrichum tortipilum]|uniref:Transmembrane protein n=1 Tax=Staphylotrichum tortipilum TaxID=2831512 RepID=A0AAN6MTM1_9PEZI|nr:hypothetical protein C8A05DRAFT_40365 [Staphylotrichum longicolle]